VNEAKEGAARQAIRETSDRLADDVAAFFEDALQSEREVWTTCGKCNRKTLVSVPDWAARQRAVEAMLDQGYGRPKPEGEGGGSTFVVERYIVQPGDDLDTATPSQTTVHPASKAGPDQQPAPPAG
jgi:hypothetical protein